MRSFALGQSVIVALAVGVALHALVLHRTVATTGTPSLSVSPEALHKALRGRDLPETRVDSYN
jgi:hypothetical protein